MVRVVWQYPAVGMHDPKSGITKFADEYLTEKKIGEQLGFWWQLEEDWQLVPGQWTIELWYGDNRLVRQSFQLTR